MLYMHNFDYDFSDPFGVIELECKGNYNLVIRCLSEQNRYDFHFEYFHGLSNNEEFFDPEDAKLYNFNKLKEFNGNFPVSWVNYKDFKKRLSEYQKISCNENTKLWIFLSMTNIVTVYSNEEPNFKEK